MINMKWWVRFRFCMNEIMNRFREFWMSVALLCVVLLVTAILILMNALNHNLQNGLQQCFDKDYERMGYFVCDDSVAVEEVEKLDTIRNFGRWGYGIWEVPELLFLADIQGKHKLLVQSGLEAFGMSMSEGIESMHMNETTWELMQLELIEGEPPQNYDLDKYELIYLGYKYKGKVEVGTVIESENKYYKKDYLIAGVLKNGTELPDNTLNLLDTSDVFSAVPADYMVLSVSRMDDIGGFVYFDLEEGVAFDDARAQLQEMAKENDLEINIASLGAKMQLLDESLKPIRKYMLEIIVTVGLTVCIVVTCYQTMSIIARKSEYGILYANGATSRDLFSIILLENLVKFLVAFMIMFPLLLFAAKLVFAYNQVTYTVLKQIIWTKVIWKTGIIGIVIMLVSSLLPIHTLRTYTPVALIGGNDT